MDLILSILAYLLPIAGFLYLLARLLFTEQGKEVQESIRYYIARIRHRSSTRILRLFQRSKAPQPSQPGDRSRFIRDVTIPDGTRIRIGRKFKKIWEIQNIGAVVWDNRFLAREGVCDGPGRLKSTSRIRVPYTLPGERCQVKIDLIASAQPGSCYAEWKMVDSSGKYLFPNETPLFVSIDVVE